MTHKVLMFHGKEGSPYGKKSTYLRIRTPTYRQPLCTTLLSCVSQELLDFSCFTCTKVELSTFDIPHLELTDCRVLAEKFRVQDSTGILLHKTVPKNLLQVKDGGGGSINGKMLKW